MVDLAVIIVTWNVRDLALQALHSLYADLEHSGLQADVYVVDSASSDGTPEAVAAAFPQVKLTASQENLGFVGGNNLAAYQAGYGTGTSDEQLPRAVYFLNPDTITQPGATRALYDALMADSGLGLVGARLTYEDGSFQHSAFRFPGLRQMWAEFFPTPGRFIEGGFNGRYPHALYEAGEPFSVDFPLGATMMLKREVVQHVGLFDPEFFMYCEEIDLAWRIHKAGWDVRCVPAAHVVHLSGQSTSQARARMLVRLWTSRLLLFHKHHPRWKYHVARLLIAAGMRLKALRAKKQSIDNQDTLIDAYRQVWEMALKQ